MESGGFIRKNERRPSRQARYEPAYIISGFEKLRFSIAKRVSPMEIPFCNKKSARRESNPRPPPWQGDAPPLSHSRIVLCKIALTRTSDILSHVPIKVNTIIILFFSLFFSSIFFFYFFHAFSHLTHNCELSLPVSHTTPQALSHPSCNW